MRRDRLGGGGLTGCCGPKPPAGECCGAPPGSNKVKLQASAPPDGASGVDPQSPAAFAFDRPVRVLATTFKGPAGNVVFDILADIQHVALRPLAPLPAGHYSATVTVDGDSGVQTTAAIDFDVAETSS